jgi:hypothetical protein
MNSEIQCWNGLPSRLDEIIKMNGKWPNDPDLQFSAWEDFSRLPDELKNEFLINRENGWMRNIHNHQKPVILLPVVLGYISVEKLEDSKLIGLLYVPQFRLKLAEIIAFSPNYYQTAFQFARNFTYLQQQ